VLASKTNTPVRGPWVLCRISLATGAVRRGPTYPTGGLTMASGYLWVYSAAGVRAQPVVSQVSPVTLGRVLPAARRPPRRNSARASPSRPHHSRPGGG
jgi:hypothetical protein